MRRQQLEYQDIFVPGGFPRHTYNPRDALHLESQLEEAQKNLCKLVVVTGQTKSGKTVLTQTVLPRNSAIWIDGGSPSTEEEFWQILVESLEEHQSAEFEISSASGRQVAPQANIGLATFCASINSSKAKSKKEIRTKSSRIAALKGLRGANRALVIDDFHYLSKDLQGNLVRALKPLIFEGVPVVAIAIPHRRYDAIKVEKEMTGRIKNIHIPSWTFDELCFIPEQGFSLLGYQMGSQPINELSDNAIGSPHLMQEFCRALCKLLPEEGAYVDHNKSRQTFIPSTQDIHKQFESVADTAGRPMFQKLAQGPRQRSDRIARKLADGRAVDIYQLVLHALAHLKPGLETYEYEDLRTAIRNVSLGPYPQIQEVARVLRHMAQIAATDNTSAPVIDFEEEEKKLHVTDPFFAFYLRWGDLVVADKASSPARRPG